MIAAKTSPIGFQGPVGQLKRGIAQMMPAPVARLFTNTCRFGSFLVSSMTSRH